jgi:hypothetical protein
MMVTMVCKLPIIYQAAAYYWTLDTVPDQKGLESLDRGLCQSVTRGDENNVVLWLKRW